MRKRGFIIPLLLFAAVFCVTLVYQRYTLAYRESVGLFLLTPDWLSEVFSRPWPLSNFLGSFLVQFYSEPAAGPIIPAAVITVIYLCLDVCLGRFRVSFHRVIALALALAVWCLASGLDSQTFLAAALLFSAALALISLLFARRGVGGGLKWREIVLCGVLVLCASLFVALRPATKAEEEMSKVIVCADAGRWNDVLSVATPSKVSQRPEMMPFALLALNAETRLGEDMFDYPVSGPGDLDMSGAKTALGNLFQSLLFDVLDVPNEAAHQMFQFATNYDHGITHLTLRRLVKYNVEAGLYSLACKYARILRCNLYYRPAADNIIRRYGAMEDSTDSLEVHSSVAAALSEDPAIDMLQLYRGGNRSQAVIDRLFAYLLLRNDLEQFRQLFYTFDWTGRKIPKLYRQALILAQ